MNLSAATIRAYRTGYNTMWKHAGAYMARKNLPRSGEFKKDNLHKGMLWASRKECKLTDKMAGSILERVYESGKVGLDQLKQVRHSLSYAYYLTTGRRGENYPEVVAQWRSFDLSTLPDVRRPVKPTKIPTPANLKTAFRKQWTPEHALNFMSFLLGLICAWDTHIFGLRPNVDTVKVKVSKDHDVDPNQGYAWTEMVGGRSKLHNQKRGTRPWKVWRVCTCQGQHEQPPWPLDLDEDGNPVDPVNWNTCCPVAAMELMHNFQGHGFQVYKKFLTSQGRYGNQNKGDIATTANEWLYAQGIPGPFDRNSGRKSLSRWLDHLRVPYPESLHIHGDLEVVWRNHYEKTLLKSGLKTREQSLDPDLATRALRRFAQWLHEDGQPAPSIKEQLQALLASLE